MYAKSRALGFCASKSSVSTCTWRERHKRRACCVVKVIHLCLSPHSSTPSPWNFHKVMVVCKNIMCVFVSLCVWQRKKADLYLKQALTSTLGGGDSSKSASECTPDALKAHRNLITQIIFRGGLGHIWPPSLSVCLSVSFSILKNGYSALIP